MKLRFGCSIFMLPGNYCGVALVLVWLPVVAFVPPPLLSSFVYLESFVSASSSEFVGLPVSLVPRELMSPVVS